MFMLFLIMLFSLFLVLVFYMLNCFLSVKCLNLEKNSSFESGFESIGKIHSSFSVHFFIIMLMFVIFDLEIIMLMGLMMSSLYSALSLLLILLFILGGFYMEWYFGKLVWMI